MAWRTAQCVWHGIKAESVVHDIRQSMCGRAQGRVCVAWRALICATVPGKAMSIVLPWGAARLPVAAAPRKNLAQELAGPKASRKACSLAIK